MTRRERIAKLADLYNDEGLLRDGLERLRVRLAGVQENIDAAEHSLAEKLQQIADLESGL